MTPDEDLISLAHALNNLAKLYQFRSLEKRLYGRLTVSQSYCLRILYFQGSRKMSELASELGVRLSTMTGIVDQLERKGLVERADHPGDRRSLHVNLTPKGRKLYQGGHETFLSYLKPVMDNRNAAERTTMLRFLSDVTGAIRGWQENPNRKRRSHGNKNS